MFGAKSAHKIAHVYHRYYQVTDLDVIIEAVLLHMQVHPRHGTAPQQVPEAEQVIHKFLSPPST